MWTFCCNICSITIRSNLILPSWFRASTEASILKRMFLYLCTVKTIKWSSFRPYISFFFNVLLTVHLSIFILVINQLDTQNFCFTISLFHDSTCFEHHVLIIRRSKIVLYSLWCHHTYRCDGTRGSTCFEHHVLIIRKSKIVLYSLWCNHTYKCDDTRGCIIQFLTSWWWSHGGRNM